MQEFTRLFIGGSWRSPSTGDVIEVIESHTERPVARVPCAGPADVEWAVQSARQAFDRSPWRELDVADRIAAVKRLIDRYAERAAEMTSAIVSETGCTLGFAKLGQVGAPLDIMSSMVELAAGVPWEEQCQGRWSGYLLRREPVGVAGAVVAWNVPQTLIATKLTPALLAGCTVVVKAAPEAALDAMLLAEVVEAAELPPGTVSILPGGVEAGEALVAHRGVDKVAFTGSTAAGRKIAAVCGERLARLSLELGGKSAAIVLDDADLDELGKGLRFASFVNNGQACAAQTRVLVPRAREAEALDAIVSHTADLAVGDPFVKGTAIGPLVSDRQRTRVRSYIDLGVREGARLVLGGSAPPPDQPTGYFVSPTVFAGVDNRMRIAQEEIFGPVLAVIPYEDDEDAIRIANESSYGLAGSVWTADRERGIALARRVRTGTFGLNGYAPDPLAPFGGFKDSGFGREWGRHGLDEYVELKAINGV